MKQCIEREAALTELCRGCSMHSLNANFFCGGACPKHERIAAIPAADVREVVHGKWIPWMRIPEDYYCDKCEWHNRIKTNLCPNCGADMRQSGDDHV